MELSWAEYCESISRSELASNKPPEVVPPSASPKVREVDPDAKREVTSPDLRTSSADLAPPQGSPLLRPEDPASKPKVTLVSQEELPREEKVVKEPARPASPKVEPAAAPQYQEPVPTLTPVPASTPASTQPPSQIVPQPTSQPIPAVTVLTLSPSPKEQPEQTPAPAHSPAISSCLKCLQELEQEGALTRAQLVHLVSGVIQGQPGILAAFEAIGRDKKLFSESLRASLRTEATPASPAHGASSLPLHALKGNCLQTIVQLERQGLITNAQGLALRKRVLHDDSSVLAVYDGLHSDETLLVENWLLCLTD